MCGVAGMVGRGATRAAVEAMVAHQHHRGPDAQWVVGGPGGWLGCDRLAIIDRSAAADRPLAAPDGTRFAFESPPVLRQMLLQGVDEIGLTLSRAAQIDAWREHDRQRRPWAY